MTQQIHLWEISKEDELISIDSAKVDLEKRLENWLKSNIHALDPNLMVIGQQVRTEFGRTIDLLCLDNAGDTVIIELKTKADRDVIGQVLDYATWIKDLGDKDIRKIASGSGLLEGTLEQVFQETFDQELPSELNLKHRCLIVADSSDGSPERIVRYLSDLGVQINFATVQHFKDQDGREMLAHVNLIEPENAVVKPPTKRGLPTAQEMVEQAYEKGEQIGELYKVLSSSVSGILNTATYGRESRGFNVKVAPNKWRAVFVVELGESNSEVGLALRLNGSRLMTIFGINEQELETLLPDRQNMDHTNWRGASPDEVENWKGYWCYFRTEEEIQTFIDGLRSSRS